MNTRAVIGVVAIIIVGVGAYMFLGRGSGLPSLTPAGGGAQSLQQLVAAGSPVTCTFSTTTADGSQSGTIYIANGMVAGDFTTATPQGSIGAHMITRDQTNYVWTSASNQGFKSTVTADSSASGQSQGVDYNAPMDYSCQPWTVDAGKFSLPANISFMSTADFVAPPQGAGATGAGNSSTQGSAAACSACDSLTGAEKAQCLAVLNC